VVFYAKTDGRKGGCKHLCGPNVPVCFFGGGFQSGKEGREGGWGGREGEGKKGGRGLPHRVRAGRAHFQVLQWSVFVPWAASDGGARTTNEEDRASRRVSPVLSRRAGFGFALLEAPWATKAETK
jgi:hypothetical protein